MEIVREKTESEVTSPEIEKTENSEVTSLQIESIVVFARLSDKTVHLTLMNIETKLAILKLIAALNGGNIPVEDKIIDLDWIDTQ